VKDFHGLTSVVVMILPTSCLQPSVKAEIFSPPTLYRQKVLLAVKQQ